MIQNSTSASACYGGDGDDFITGHSGDDGIWGGDGKDTLEGGDGDDTYVVDSADDVIVTDTSGTDEIQSSFQYNLVPTIIDAWVLIH